MIEETPSQRLISTCRNDARLFYEAVYDGASECPFCGAPVDRNYDHDEFDVVPYGYPFLCKCIDERQKRAEMMRHGEIAGSDYARRFTDSHIPLRYMDASTRRDIGSWYFHGPNGAGKTYEACALLLKALSKGQSAFFVRMADVVGAGFDKREKMMEHMSDADVLCIDDLGRGETSEWADAVVFRAIDERYANDKPLIITSNYSPLELASAIAARSDITAARATVDRICGRGRGMCVAVEFGGRHETEYAR